MMKIRMVAGIGSCSGNSSRRRGMMKTKMSIGSWSKRRKIRMMSVMMNMKIRKRRSSRRKKKMRMKRRIRMRMIINSMRVRF